MTTGRSTIHRHGHARSGWVFTVHITAARSDDLPAHVEDITLDDLLDLQAELTKTIRSLVEDQAADQWRS